MLTFKGINLSIGMKEKKKKLIIREKNKYILRLNFALIAIILILYILKENIINS